jgi:transcription termination factor NusB
LTAGTIRENVQAMLYAWVAGELSGLREIDLRWIYYDTRSENRTWVADARVSTEEASAFLEKDEVGMVNAVLDKLARDYRAEDLAKSAPAREG